MPKRTDINCILIIGSGPITVGQACEFDYAGTQACYALKAEGYRVILINSNPATIMTDPTTADQIYIRPISVLEIERIIQIEKPQAILPTMGGQTAINITMELIQNGILEKYQIELIGANEQSILKAEDRGFFLKSMKKIGLKTPKSGIANTLHEAIELEETLGFPVMIRPSFTLGGYGSGIVRTYDEFVKLCETAFMCSPTHQILVEKSISGWKEFELEVVRDKSDNSIIVCTIENFDPMGIHTGDSITVAPAQTLTDKEYQIMRRAAIEVLKEIGVETGGANVQFAVDPKTGEMVVIEMNPRVSRSSALASKATGFPIARVAAKLAVGYTLDELKNEITGDHMPASYEPTQDYVVVKMPRFQFDKFKDVKPHLTTQMQSVGEVMAIGSTFQMAFQKALCSLEKNYFGLKTQIYIPKTEEHWQEFLGIPSPERVFYIAEAFRCGLSDTDIHQYTGIDLWFLWQIQELIVEEQDLMHKYHDFNEISKEQLRHMKQIGFSDIYLAQLFQKSESEVRARRLQLEILPAYKKVDTCSGEFPIQTGYFYSTYEAECESKPSNSRKILIMGSGPNRIGQGIEFDYCCVHAALAARKLGYETIMINCNPSTVSTDYCISDKLYFEPLTLEHILSVYDLENPIGILIQFGGQTPLKLSNNLCSQNVSILGTSVKEISQSEDRDSFRKRVQDLHFKLPKSEKITCLDSGLLSAERIGYPIIARPSFVLGGDNMQIFHDRLSFHEYLLRNPPAINYGQLIIDKFLESSIEVDVDLVRDGQDTWIAGILENIEPAGIHSGDSKCVIPTIRLSDEILLTIIEQSIQLANIFHVIGLMNIQFAIQGRDIYVLEVNLRASRTIPFISKAIDLPVAQIATRCILGVSLRSQGLSKRIQPSQACMKVPVFVYDKFKGAHQYLGPEMTSMGETMIIESSVQKLEEMGYI